MTEPVRHEALLKAYELQDKAQEIWEHFKQCALCKTQAAWPSRVCSEMDKLRMEQYRIMAQMDEMRRRSS